MRIRLIILLLVLINLTVYSERISQDSTNADFFGIKNHTFDPNKNAIELIDLIHIFAESSSWKVAAEYGKYPIKWITGGTQENDDKYSKYAYTRVGEAVVKLNGKYSETLGQYLEPSRWEITLQGSHAGVGKVNISSNLNYDYDVFDFEKYLDENNINYSFINKPGVIQIGASLTEYNLKLNFDKTNSLWVICSVGGGSGGGNIDIEMYFSEEDYLNKWK